MDRVFKCSQDKKHDCPLRAKQNVREFASDTYQNRHTLDAALMSAGSTVEAVKGILTNQVDSAFAIVRPPGHHAHNSAAGGFCFFNNAAIAARVAQKQHGVKKVCIFDWDVHVGDGTANIFMQDNTVLYISIHRYDMGKFYPGKLGRHDLIGEGNGRGYNIQWPFNVPQKVDDRIGDRDYIFACD